MRAGTNSGVPLDAAQRDAFARHGVLCLPGLVPDEVVASIRERLHRQLELAGCWRDGRWITESGDRSSGRAPGRLARRLKEHAKREDLLSPLDSDRVRACVDELLDGAPVRTATISPVLLYTPPGPDTWHLDAPRLGEAGLPGVQMFTFLVDVGPGCGGTAVAAGSHRLVNDEGFVRSSEVKLRLCELEWFRKLFAPGTPEERRALLDGSWRLGDVELQIVELTGRPGDVWLMDLRVLHALTPNSGERPRLMATQRYFDAALAARVGLEVAPGSG